MGHEPKTKLDLDRIGTFYCELMEEICVRDELVMNTLARPFSPVPSMANTPGLMDIVIGEFCYLQLRMMCELIALACLAAHGDIEAARANRIIKAYEADRIVKILEKLHPKFYPTPSKQTGGGARAGGGRMWNPVPITTGFLTKADLLKLYTECGRHLHRGPFKSAIAERPTAPDSTRILNWAGKIWTLLEHHQIQLIDPRLQIIGLMKDKGTSRAQFSFWKRRDDGLSEFHRAARATP